MHWWHFLFSPVSHAGFPLEVETILSSLEPTLQHLYMLNYLTDDSIEYVQKRYRQGCGVVAAPQFPITYMKVEHISGLSYIQLL
jgi:hypothetical protein